MLCTKDTITTYGVITGGDITMSAWADEDYGTCLDTLLSGSGGEIMMGKGDSYSVV